VIIRVRIGRLTIDRQLQTEPATIRAAMRKELGGMFHEHVPPAGVLKARLGTAIQNTIRPRVGS
jgi:hypothetical protein